MKPARLWPQALAVFLFCCAVCAWFQFQTPYLPEPDCYYHIKLSALMRQHGLFLKGFPWAHFSLWREGFSDGSLLYHLLLIPFTFGGLALGGKIAGVLFSALALTSFFMILTLNRVPNRIYWFWLLLMGGSFFWWRLLDVRPQVLSITLLLWSLHFLLNDRKKPFAALCFLYPFAYVAAFLPVVFAALRAAYLKAMERRSEHRIFLLGLGAYALAMVLHPYFPKDIRFFYVQNLVSMFYSVTHQVALSQGGEIRPMDTLQLLSAHGPLILHLLAVLFAFMHLRPPLSERTRVLFPITVTLVFLTLVSKRFIEYSLPVSTLFCAFAFSDVFPGGSPRSLLPPQRGAARALLAVWLVMVAAASGSWVLSVRGQMSRVKPPQFERLARTLAAQAPAGEVIYTCDWDEPPELLYFNDQHRYFVMLDPVFMYSWDPALWRLWHGAANVTLPPDEIHRAFRERFQARFGLCSQRSGAFRELVGRDRRYKILDEDGEGFVFKVL
ncbi:MAG: hypothetical protein NTY77_04860 [Elusimicrobia bacterium]|nr:hypothetical protein [Elusimicrobiota bacterium]